MYLVSTTPLYNNLFWIYYCCNKMLVEQNPVQMPEIQFPVGKDAPSICFWNNFEMLCEFQSSLLENYDLSVFPVISFDYGFFTSMIDPHPSRDYRKLTLIEYQYSAFSVKKSEHFIESSHIMSRIPWTWEYICIILKNCGKQILYNKTTVTK